MTGRSTTFDNYSRLGVPADWLYHNYKDLPFWLRVGRRPRFSENGIEDYIRKRRNN